MIQNEKIAIRTYDNDYESDLIFHSTPMLSNINCYELYKYQWYLTKDKSLIGNPIKDEKYESYIITTELIKEKGYEGLYLYCKLIDRKTNKESNTEYIRLFSNFNKMIENGTVFDDISFYDKNGAIL